MVERVLYEMENAYSAVVWTLPDNFDSKEKFMDSLKRLDMNSSPGYPYCKLAATNREYLGFNGLFMDEDKVNMLWHDVRSIFEGVDVDFMLRVFIKPEPHTIDKINEGRFRLIMASPLCYQIVWHMLFDSLNDLEIEKTYDIPSQQGLILPMGEWKHFLRQWKSRGYDTGLDKRAWDWTAPYWLIEMELEFRLRMGRGSRMEEWHVLAVKMYRMMFAESKLILSDGSVYHQTVPGVMKSGCVNTISANSHMQVMIHILACWDQGISIHPLPVCCGDDTLQRMEQAIDLTSYAKYGALVKTASAGLEFVGHEFLQEGPIPIYHEKHLCKALSVPDDILPDYIDSMCRMYCKNRVMFDFWTALAEELRCVNKIKSRQYYVTWYDFEV